MASPLKGAVSFKIGEESHSIAFSAESLWRLEKVIGVGPMELEERMKDPKAVTMDLMRTVFWAGMLDEMPELDLEDVGKLLSKLPPLEAVKLATTAFIGAFVDPEAQAPGPSKPGQKAAAKAAGTGSAS